MLNIGQYFEKFAKLGLKNEFTKNSVVEVVKKVIGVTLPFSSIDYKNHSLFIKAHPAVKSMIFVKRNQIIEGLKELGITIVELK